MSVVIRKILVVDDDPAIRRFLTTILEQANYQVAVAADGLEALEYVRCESPQFVITDWEMPTLNGAELCQALSQGRTAALRVYRDVDRLLLTGRRSLLRSG